MAFRPDSLTIFRSRRGSNWRSGQVFYLFGLAKLNSRPLDLVIDNASAVQLHAQAAKAWPRIGDRLS
jgi:hypothetical protein